jgi:uncharacterized membrane protein YhaH (DUF805 family)
MTLVEAAKIGFRKYFVFSGRASRQEYWKFVLSIFLIAVLITIINGVIFGPTLEETITTTVAADGSTTKSSGVTRVYDGGTLGTIFSLFCVIPGLSAAARRLHDTNRSGWWLCAPLVISILGIISAILVEVGPVAMLEALRSTGSIQVQLGSGFSVLLALIVFASWITLLVWLCQRSSSGPNRFGSNSLDGVFA